MIKSGNYQKNQKILINSAVGIFSVLDEYSKSNLENATALFFSQVLGIVFYEEQKKKQKK